MACRVTASFLPLLTLSHWHCPASLHQNLYLGNERSMLLQNTLFRVGGAAIALSSHISHGFNAKYKLLHTVRTQNTQVRDVQPHKHTHMCGVSTHHHRHVLHPTGRRLWLCVRARGSKGFPWHSPVKGHHQDCWQGAHRQPHHPRVRPPPPPP